ncbi:glutathione S-transferase U17-like [Humulus lupulus]|uniref:glutathione S-transferase U17-like n=1 Tax=Humulus lupulus TaxID=3486 RepID=UPI002B4090F4|nr:glutathione S-transferase U17-like [Humulus lupulus]
MAESCVKLIGTWTSPFVLRARIGLSLKHVQYEFLEEKFGPKSDLLLNSNPVYKKVPVLIHANKPIPESLVILEYIDEVWASSGPSILSSDPYDRAMDRFWAAYIDEKMTSIIRGLAISPVKEGAEVALEQVKTGIMLLEETFRERNKGKAFFGGDEIGFIDIAFGCLLSLIKATQIRSGLQLIHPARAPLLTHWAKRFNQHSHVFPYLPDPHKLAEFAELLSTRAQAQAQTQAEV